MKIPHKHAAISVRNPQAARPRSRSALQQANTLRRSEITNFRVSSALECLAHVMEARWRQDFTRGDRCPRLHAPPNGFHFDGNWVLVWLFFRPRVRGSQGTSPFEFRHYRQTRFGYARSKRSQPQFKAHNSVRPFENGLRSLGSSATRPYSRLHPSSVACWLLFSLRSATFPLVAVSVHRAPDTARPTAGTLTSTVLTVSRRPLRSAEASPHRGCFAPPPPASPAVASEWWHGVLGCPLWACRTFGVDCGETETQAGLWFCVGCVGWCWLCVGSGH